MYSNPNETKYRDYKPLTLEEAIKDYIALRENRDGWVNKYHTLDEFTNDLASQLLELQSIHKKLKDK